MWNNTLTELYKAGTMDHVQRLQKEVCGAAGRFNVAAEVILVEWLRDTLENSREEEANKIQAIVRGENQRKN